MINISVIGDEDDRLWIKEKIEGLPYRFKKELIKDYQYIYTKNKEQNRGNANEYLRELVEEIPRAAFRLSSSDNELIEYAEKNAKKCAIRAARFPEKAREECETLTASVGVKIPEGKHLTEHGAVERMKCSRWWRRGIRSSQGRIVESTAIKLGLVHKKSELYCSDETLQRRKGQKTRNRRMLEAVQAVNELGQNYTLAELADLSISNPEIRRGELMTRIAGFEMLADKVGHIGEFYTFTCPSRMHSRHHDTGNRNKKYDGTTPREAQQYIAKVWSRIRAALARRDIVLYGFRVAEPQHDGTPHWHLLLFMQEEHRSTVRAICEKYCLKVDGNEPGAKKHRFKAVGIDKRKGTAAGYIAKYIAKNIDGYGIDEDLFGKDPKASAARVDAWASTWGIRQFQQIGGPPVTIWRELRRLRGGEGLGGVLEEAAIAADNGNWQGFVVAMGGIEMKRDDRPVRLAKKTILDEKTGEIPLNRYGEIIANQIYGLECGALIVPTRIHEWKIERGNIKNNETNQLVIEVINQKNIFNSGKKWGEGAEVSRMAVYRDFLRRGRPIYKLLPGGFSLSAHRAPWSPVNNCTVSKNNRNIRKSTIKNHQKAGMVSIDTS